MKYKAWDKKSDLNGKTALELIGEEQMKNKDVFIIFTDDNDNFVALESVATLRAIHNFQGETIDEIAYEYIELKKGEAKRIPTLEERVAFAEDALNTLLSGGTL